MSAKPTRRGLLRGAAAATATLATPISIATRPTSLSAAPADMRAAVNRITGGTQPKAGRVKLEVPPLSENGNTVPITVTVQSPMTPKDYVKAIHVLNEKNPQPHVISAWFGPRAGQAMVQTRARLSDTQTVIAIAQMSDGTFWMDSASVIVTLGACLEEPI